jgi:very-short-patch-repair endonuclease
VGTLDVLGCDVFALPGSADTHDRRRWAALLAAGADARLTHEASADLYRIDGIRRGLIVVTARHPRHLNIPGATLHQLDDLMPHHLAAVNGWPTTTPARTVVDLAAVVSWMRLATALEYVVIERLSSFTAIRDVLSDVRRRGKPGVRKLVSVLEARSGEPVAASDLERKLHDAVALAGLKLVRQYPLPWKREPIEGLVDGALPESRILVEADGRKWHARLAAMAKDRRRDRTAAAAGWQTLRWMYEDFAYMRFVAAELRDVHDSRVSAVRNSSA